jgi:hypothetical protein
MTKRHFIALADAIRESNRIFAKYGGEVHFSNEHLQVLADFCASQNPAFLRQRWINYIDGKCGPNGGAVKKAKPEYQPKTGERCSCKPGVYRDNCPECEGTGYKIDFAVIRSRA